MDQPSLIYHYASFENLVFQWRISSGEQWTNALLWL